MYSSSYSPARYGLDTKKLQEPKSKSCSYYLKIIFFFSSLIQSLIIISLVLFLVYGNSKQTAEEKRVEDLEHSSGWLVKENHDLRLNVSKLKQELNRTQTFKLQCERDLPKLRLLANTSSLQLQGLQKKLAQCEMEKRTLTPVTRTIIPPGPATVPNTDVKSLQSQIQHLETKLLLVSTNFSQTVERLSAEKQSAVKEKNDLRMEAIELRRSQHDLEKELQIYSTKCQKDFVQSLQGINEVTKAFLARIKNVFETTPTFHLTCDALNERINKIHNNCSSLSREVESKFQQYLNSVGSTISHVQMQSSRLMVRTEGLEADLRWCRTNGSARISAVEQRLRQAQERHDQEVERLLKQQKELQNSRELMSHQLRVKDSDITLLATKIENLHASLSGCAPKVSPVRLQHRVSPCGLSCVPLLSQPPVPKPASPGALPHVPPKPLSPAAGGVAAAPLWPPGPGAKAGMVADVNAELNAHIKELQKYAG